MAWNQRAARALERITHLQPLLTHCSQISLWFAEELQVLKRDKMPKTMLEEEGLGDHLQGHIEKILQSSLDSFSV